MPRVIQNARKMPAEPLLRWRKSCMAKAQSPRRQERLALDRRETAAVEKRLLMEK